jgi:tryptophanyl-tRNA synthetase
VDPAVTPLYVQSHVPEHTELHYLLECATGYGEAHRMIQFKEKSTPQSRLSLLTYPVLMAADILLLDVDEVRVGDDQSQHVELARDVAIRFNRRYGETFVVPRVVNPRVAARVKDLSDPTAKMGKTNASTVGVVELLDPPEVIRRKVRRAVTDAGSDVSAGQAVSPGVANLLEILAACRRVDPSSLSFGSYGELKAATADAVAETLGPIQERYRSMDPGYVRDVLAAGAAQVRERGAQTVHRAREAIGLLATAA